ncbi:ATP-dependent Clp protease adapter ClpS [Synechococcus sp. Nb3U1]|uniref:ATP-dependent Clp protease adapter ClpS n=1 Tax=Synechococcus sp. Nb3U1 TaxID=1914529 RepID=UPI001F26E55A|nr:ATP-dependent Clp protease adapter ClpS [Synechococcus sp. Nb3U1]MCF2970138.1 ATP-dependent Clp protease adapter ClpS [Synechococcus sp. Nb3U1]
MPTETLVKPSVTPKHMPMYRVLLHNDDFNTMEYVVGVLVQVIPAMMPPQATEIMLEAHNNGMAVVIVVPQEHAEFYCEQLRQHGLTSSIEPER